MTLLRNEEIIIVKKANGTWSKGHHTDGTTSYVQGKSSVQPLNDRELQMLEEGDRVKSTKKFYTETMLLDDDFVRRKKENVKKVVTCTIYNVIDSTDYTCTINGTQFLYNSGIGATAFTIAAGIVLEILGGTELIVVVDNLDGSYTITSTIEGTNFTIEVDTNQSFVVDTANVKKEYKIKQDKDYTSHNIAHYKAYGFLVERNNGL